MYRFYQILIMIVCLLISFPTNLSAQVSINKDIATVQALLFRQQADWNAGKIEAFMEGYWQSDQLKFIGATGVTYGYDETLKGYYRRYPDRTAMGQLTFEVISTEKLSRKVIMLVGKWDLERTIGDIGGVFTLLFKKIKGKWVIISDHTSARPSK